MTLGQCDNIPTEHHMPRDQGYHGYHKQFSLVGCPQLCTALNQFHSVFHKAETVHITRDHSGHELGQ